MTKHGAQTAALASPEPGRLTKWCSVAVLALLASACVKGPIASAPAAERAQIASSLTRDIAVLASDEYGGRLPGTDGGELTVNYIIERLQDAGFESGTNDPGNPWRAPVRLSSSEPKSSAVRFRVRNRVRELSEDAAVAFSPRKFTLVENADALFVGRLANTVREEDIAGKVAVMLGEAGVSPARRATLFAKGAAAVITVLDSKDEVASIRMARTRQNMSLGSDEADRLTAFVDSETLGKAVGEAQWDALIERSEDASFTPVELNSLATIEAQSDYRDFTSFNVIGRLPGKIPGSGAILLLAHWDHLGQCGPPEADDRLCNGAIDNASGIAVMLELARRIKAMEPLDRDVYVLATTAEEAGLLGIRAFVEQPAIPLDSIVAAFNFDTVAVAPSGSAVGFIGEGRTPLDNVIRKTLSDGKRTLGSRELAEAFIQRQDGWTLLQEGVPSVFLSTAFGSEITLSPYLETHYHRASDDVDVIELGGAIDDLLLHEELIKRIGNLSTYPGEPR